MFCTNLNEPSDPHTWDDNYICYDRGLEIKWSNNGVIDGLHCTSVDEPSEEPSSQWQDNYLCSRFDLGLVFRSSSGGTHQDCVSFHEPSEPDSTTWWDNYLCWDSGKVQESLAILATEPASDCYLKDVVCSDCPYPDFDGIVSPENQIFRINPVHMWFSWNRGNVFNKDYAIVYEGAPDMQNVVYGPYFDFQSEYFEIQSAFKITANWTSDEPVAIKCGYAYERNGSREVLYSEKVNVPKNFVNKHFRLPTIICEGGIKNFEVLIDGLYGGSNVKMEVFSLDIDLKYLN